MWLTVFERKILKEFMDQVSTVTLENEENVIMKS